MIAADQLLSPPVSGPGDRVHRGVFLSWRLPLANGIAAAAIIGAVALRLYQANLPRYAAVEEISFLGAGIAYAAVAVWVRSSTTWADDLPVALGMMVINTILALGVLGVAAPWLMGDLPPMAVAVFATMVMFDLGFGSRRFLYVLGVAVSGLAILWVYAFLAVHVPALQLVIWAFLLLGLALLAYVTLRITDRNLEMQAARQASLLEAISDLGEGLLVTENGRLIASNAAYQQLTGYTQGELEELGSLVELAPPEERQALVDRMSERLHGDTTPVYFESALITKDARRVRIEMSIHRLVAEGETRLLAIVRDISDRHRAIEALSTSEARFRILFEQTQAGMAFGGVDGNLLSANAAFCQLVGYPEDELKGRGLLDITHPDDVATSQLAMRRMLDGEAPGFRFEKRYIHKDGQEVWVDESQRLVRDADRNPGYFQNVVVDIRDRKRNEVQQAARFAVTRALATSPGWDGAAVQVLEALCMSLDWEVGEYWEVDADREVMQFGTLWHVPDIDIEALEASVRTLTLKRGEGLAGEVWESGAPVAIEDPSDVRYVRSEAARTLGLRSVIGFPVRSGRRVVGVIALNSRTERRLDEGLLAVMNDVGSQIGEFVERKRAEGALQESEKRMRSVLDNVSDGLVTIDSEGRIESVNPSVVQLFGYTPEELIGQQAEVLIATANRGGFMEYVQHRVRKELPASGTHETMGRRKEGSLFPLEFIVSSMKLGSRHLFIATLRDISERKAHTDALEYQALHDALTGLPNRSLFNDRLRQALLAARRNRQSFGVLLLDLNRFKDINDAFGHDRGDSLLQEVAARIRGALRATDTVARLGGDEFAVLTTEAKNPESIVAAALKILTSLEAPFAIGDQMVESGASIGIALYPQHGDDPATLLRRADVAMYVAKRSGLGHTVYSPEHEAQAFKRSGLAGELRRSIAQGELVLHYQPQMKLSSGATYGVEALVRWNHPREGMLPPDRFIPMAEDTGMIRPLTDWVLDSALRQLRAWMDSGMTLSMAVNISPQSVEDPSLVETVARALSTWGIEPSRLTLEVTESVAMAGAAGKALHNLSDMGVQVSLDDFGTGYSSLLYLKRLPVSEIKIDRSFVSGLASDGDSAAIVRSAVGLGHNLGLRVVAEGLQDRHAEAILMDSGCDAAQGFLIGRPVSGLEMTSYLSTTAGAERAVARMADQEKASD